MAATLTQERFSGPEWIFERKLDGIRLLAFKQGADVRLFSRNRLPQNIPAVTDAIARLPPRDLILDGELTGAWGPPTMREADKPCRLAYHVFDIVWLDGRDVSTLPLDERRALLGALPLRILVVGGFTEPQGSRVGLGALLVGYFEGQDFVFAGKVGTGFDTELLLDLRSKLNAIEIAKPPFTTSVGLPKVRAHWVRPTVVVQVAFIEWTVHGKLRHPGFLGVRTDKTAREVVRERP